MIKCSRREGGHDIPSAINFPGYRQGHDLFSDLAGSGEQSAHLPVATRPSLPHGRLVTLIRGSLTGPNPVDRGKPGSKIHVLSDRRGLPLSVAVSAANTHDSQALKPLVMAIPAVKSRRGRRRRKPDKLHADEAYDSRDLRAWVRDRGIGVRIARKGRRVRGEAGQTPLGHRTHDRLAVRLPTTGHPIRTQRQPLLRVSHPCGSPGLLQETPHMRQALSFGMIASPCGGEGDRDPLDSITTPISCSSEVVGGLAQFQPFLRHRCTEICAAVVDLVPAENLIHAGDRGSAETHARLQS